MIETTSRLEPGDVERLRRSCRNLITPDDADYDEARRLWNAMHDRRPALIARPNTGNEVAAAVQFARERDLEVVVRAGGHSVHTMTGAPGCLVVDLSAMHGVEVDADARTARANGGALLGELDVAAQAHGLVCPVGVVGHTGVAGLTLGGGIGRLQRHFGLTIDSLIAVELVTADGRLVRASETEEPELFWGLRGAGWNFGIATAFEFRLHPFGPDLHRGVLTFPAGQIRDAWAAFRDYAAGAPDAVAAIFGVEREAAPEGSPADTIREPVVFIAYNHSGEARDVERDTAALYRGPKPQTATLGSEPYLDVQVAHDLQFAPGGRSFIKGHHVDDVRADALDAWVDLVAAVPGEGTISVTMMGGAIGRVEEDATAYAGRAAPFDISADSAWTDAALDDANVDWVRRAVAVTEPDATVGRYPNENADIGPEETRLIYGDAHLARLVALKRQWDPDNVFHVNHNVLPAPPTRDTST